MYVFIMLVLCNLLVRRDVDAMCWLPPRRTGKGLMISIPCECCGKVLARYSRAVICTLLVDDLAILTVAEIGFMGGAVCIRV